MIDPAELARLTHHRWAVPVLCELAALHGSKFITLVHRLEAHHDAVRQALDALIELGLIIPNPGYGHPLRPEYILTDLGHAAAPVCMQLNDTLRRKRWTSLGYLKWSLPALRAVDVSGGVGRFGTLRERLHGATDRAISQTLLRLTNAAWLDQTTLPDDRRASVYELAAPARQLAHTLAALPRLAPST